MTLRTTLGQLMINRDLPEDLRDYNRVLDKKGIAALLQQVAEQRPEQYREIAKRLSDIGRDVSYTTGGHSFGLQALRPAAAAKRIQLELQQQLEAIYADPKLTPAQKEKRVIELTAKRQKQLIDDVLQESRDEDNPLARQLVGAGRGNPFFLNSLRGADLLYTDHRGRVVPLPVLRNYSQGLRPSEYFAGAFGTRKGIIDLKLATADAGFFAKQLVQATHRLLVEADDDDMPYDSTSPRGLPVDVDDADNEGAFLAHPVGGYDRNTLLTPRILKDLKNRGFDRILVRSPTVGGAPHGGVYARDVGRRERGAIAPVGDYVGIAASQALAAPITQANISSKHSGGVAGASAGAIAGFKRINQLVQVPKHFPGGAAHAQLDGRVQQVREAPQGGHYVTINGEDHYVGTGFQVNVKPGDNVEAGDVLSDGIPNPAEIVKHKGIGEGRRYFVDAFRQAIADAGQYGNRRNIELVARGLINHVRLTDEVGDYVPGDVVPYQTLERSWQPRDGHLVVRPQQAVGYYLERPVLHYAIGTRIRPTMLKELERFGVQQVYAHRDPPPFAPEMIRGMANVAHDPDWMTRMLGSYQQKSLLEGARRGAVSDELGTSYAPALARGEYFGRYGASKGWDPATPETRDHRTGAGGQGPRLPVPQTTDPIAL